MVKSSGSSERTPLKKGAWSSEEDRKLINYINKYKIWNWSEMSKAAGLARSGKSCRLRWVNYLRPDIKHGNFSHEEVQTIITQHETLGNRWASIASKLPGRTDNEVKNYWHTHLKKRLINKPIINRATKPQACPKKDYEIASPKTLSESEESPKLDKPVDTNTVIESPQPMSTEDFASSPTINREIGCEEEQKVIAVDGTKSSTLLESTFGVESQNLWTQQQQQHQQAEKLEVDHHGNGGLNVAHDYSLETHFEPVDNSFVGPSGSELMWQCDQYTWTYDQYFYEDVSNDWLDYPIF